jgi:hypothetical protein
MRTVFAFLFLFLLTNGAFSQLTGNYSKKGKDFLYTLSLNADSTFSFRKVYFEADSRCEGKWKRLPDNSLLLNCGESTLAEKLQSGYMNQREIHVQVLKNNRLKVGKVIMRRS